MCEDVISLELGFNKTFFNVNKYSNAGAKQFK